MSCCPTPRQPPLRGRRAGQTGGVCISQARSRDAHSAHDCGGPAGRAGAGVTRTFPTGAAERGTRARGRRVTRGILMTCPLSSFAVSRLCRSFRIVVFELPLLQEKGKQGRREQPAGSSEALPAPCRRGQPHPFSALTGAWGQGGGSGHCDVMSSLWTEHSARQGRVT